MSNETMLQLPPLTYRQVALLQRALDTAVLVHDYMPVQMRERKLEEVDELEEILHSALHPESHPH